MMELKAKHPKMVLNTKHPQMEMRNPIKKVGIEQIPADWDQIDETAVDYIKNKPTALSQFNNDVGYITDEEPARVFHLIKNGNEITLNETYLVVFFTVQSYKTVHFIMEDDEGTNHFYRIKHANLIDRELVLEHEEDNERYTITLTAENALSTFTGELVITPIGGGQEEKVDYYLTFDRTLSTNGIFTIDNPKETDAEMIEDFRTGKARFHRALNLTYDPIDSFPKDGTKLPEYEFIGDFVTNNAGTGHLVIYRRIVGFSTTQTQQYIDNILIQINLGTNKINFIQHNYVQMFDAIIQVRDTDTTNYPHAISFINSGGLWGKTNLKFMKTSRAGYASQFNFKLRVLTHGDNVWLSPVETISANSLPRFIGESKKLGKKIIVTFNDFTDTDHPTGTIDMFDVVNVPSFDTIADEGKILKIVNGVPTWVSEE